MRAKRLLALLLIAAVLIYAWLNRQKLWEIVSVFVMAVGICLMLNPLCAAFERAGFPSTASSGISILVFLSFILLLVMLFVPYIVSQSITLIRQIMPILQRIFERTGVILYHIQGFDWLASFSSLKPAIDAATASIAKGSVSFAVFAGKFCFALVLAFYFLRERKIILAHALLCLPVLNRTAVLGVFEGCSNALKSYLCGMLKTSVFISAATYLGLLLLGIENALLLALYMGILELLPYLGPVLASIPILLSSMTISLNHTILALALIVAVQQIESNFVGLYFTASSTSVHPLAALISVFVLGTFFGLPGVLIAIPLLVSVRSCYWSMHHTCCDRIAAESE